MTQAVHARPDFVRSLPTGGSGHGPVHMTIKFVGGPKPKYTACGVPTDTTRHLGGSLFRGALTVLCSVCGDTLDRFAAAADPDNGGGT
jgi:hypothetical protein